MEPCVSVWVSVGALCNGMACTSTCHVDEVNNDDDGNGIFHACSAISARMCLILVHIFMLLSCSAAAIYVCVYAFCYAQRAMCPLCHCVRVFSPNERWELYIINCMMHTRYCIICFICYFIGCCMDGRPGTATWAISKPRKTRADTYTETFRAEAHRRRAATATRHNSIYHLKLDRCLSLYIYTEAHTNVEHALKFISFATAIFFPCHVFRFSFTSVTVNKFSDSRWQKSA